MGRPEPHPMAGAGAAVIAGATFARFRWGLRFADRGALLRFQERHLARFLRRTLPKAPYYRRWAGRPLADLPIVDKATVLDDFAAFNTRGVTLDRALGVALGAEASRDFRPLVDGLTVGLSSGTSGTRGVFLVSPAERARWAGVLLARLLSDELLRRLLDVRRAPPRVAFFLRANSNLYSTLGGRRLEFTFYDLLTPLARHLERLNGRPPDILAAPPTVLRRLAEEAAAGALRIAPRQVLSVAEVLEPEDERAVAAAFGAPVQQIYQCTEGFLGASCAAGRVHLNEELVHIEPEWLEGETGAPGDPVERRRFQPIVTDFSRTTQLVVRYRLDDVLRLAEGACPCGHPSLSLAAIEGRLDDVLWAVPVPGAAAAADEGGGGGGLAPLAPVFPDLLRRAFALADPGGALRDYRLEQLGEEWRVRLALARGGGDAAAQAEKAVRGELLGLLRRLGLRPAAISFEPWRDEPPAQKRRRIRCTRRPAVEGGPG
jgi:putative adenylate-forming enzyme